ncbi:hypothetical protein [Massilia sp. PWRC2]|uniref:hypothetical protein n=1 Tax=Massilia sp. PWRC2 TaxID=2804626 RepID=UPI003CF5B272
MRIGAPVFLRLYVLCWPLQAGAPALRSLHCWFGVVGLFSFFCLIVFGVFIFIFIFYLLFFIFFCFLSFFACARNRLRQVGVTGSDHHSLPAMADPVPDPAVAASQARAKDGQAASACA